MPNIILIKNLNKDSLSINDKRITFFICTKGYIVLAP